MREAVDRIGRRRGELPRRVACVWLPGFEVGVERARRPDLVGRPVVLIERAGAGEGVVRACSPEARVAGLEVGSPAHSVPQRSARAAILPYDRHEYERRYEEVLLGLEAVTPIVEAEPLESFYLDLTGIPGLSSGKPEAVGAAVRRALPGWLEPRVGVATGKFAARVAARAASPGGVLGVSGDCEAELLRQAPSALLPADPETLRRLDLMGLRTLGRIARLPRSAVLAEFGWVGERIHRLACGEDVEPVRPHRRPPVIRETWSFADPPSTAAQFYLALHRLLERAWSRPERQGRGVRQVRLQARLEGGGIWERRVTLRRPGERWETVFGELKRRLESALPAGALCEIAIELSALAPHLDRQEPLFRGERERRREALARELEQLRTRLGEVRVYRIVEVEPWSRLPERRYGLIRFEF